LRVVQTGPLEAKLVEKALQAVELSELMGHSPAKIDDKGRLKVPTDFRKIIAEQYGSDCFITSTDGEQALIYPLPVWFEIQARLAKVPSTSQAKAKYLQRVNYYGHAATIDGQGRVLMPQVLRNEASITDDVVVLGSHDHLIVWNEQKIQKKLADSPLSAEDLKELELHGV
jgi:transcriptional regulator MraZ